MVGGTTAAPPSLGDRPEPPLWRFAEEKVFPLLVMFSSSV